MAVLEDVERILLTEIAADRGRESLDPDEDLLGTGIIDSLGVVKLTVTLEKTFDIELTGEDVIPENFENLDSLSRLVEQKMRNR